MPISHEKEALELVLELHPVLKDAVVMTQMELPGGTHAGEDTGMVSGD
jgi:hypothetical protein